MVPYRELHGERVSVLGLGGSNFGKRIDRQRTVDVVRAALDNGINFFDVADVYGDADGRAEEFLGEAVRGRAAIIATKFGHGTAAGLSPDQGGGHPANVRRSAENSLRRLGVGRIDLFQLHEPDPRVPIADTLGALDELISDGLIRWGGCCNLAPDALAAAHQAAAAFSNPVLVTEQDEYSMLRRDVEEQTLPFCDSRGLGFLAYFPLASGVLTGKYRMEARIPAGTRVAKMKPDKLFRFFTPRALELAEHLVSLGERNGRDPVSYALGYLTAQPAVLSALVGAMSPEQVAANAKAAAVQLDEAELRELRDLIR